MCQSISLTTRAGQRLHEQEHEAISRILPFLLSQQASQQVKRKPFPVFHFEAVTYP